MANILLAEDDNSLRGFIASALEKAGHSVTPCADGLSALAAYDKDGTRYDLLLTDIVMPGMDGMELSARLKQNQPSLKVMYITGFAAMALEENGTDETKTPVMSKPFPLAALVHQVEAILRA